MVQRPASSQEHVPTGPRAVPQGFAIPKIWSRGGPRLLIAVSVVAIALAGIVWYGTGGPDSDRRGGTTNVGAAINQRGGVLRTATTDFLFTNEFDVTGEYIAHGVHDLRRACAHPGHLQAHRRAPRQRAAPRPGDRGATADRPRADLHLQAQTERQVRPAAGPGGHLQGHRLRLPAHQHPAAGRPVRRLLLRRHRGHGRQGQERRHQDLGHRDARRPDDHLPPDHADRRLQLPSGHAGHRADPQGSRQVPHQGRRLRALLDLLRALHDPGLRPARRLHAATPRSRSPASTPARSCTWSATPTTTSRPTPPAPTTSTASRSTSTPTSTTSSTRSSRGRWTPP